MLLNHAVPTLRNFAAAIFVVSCVPVIAVAEPIQPTINNTTVQQLLDVERKQLAALGSNRAKKIAGVGANASIRVASLSKPNSKITTAIASFKQLKAMAKASGGPEWACLTEALYFEARGESFKSISAVGEVVLNRRNSSRYPSTICGVISQGVGGRPGCQFSYKCDGKSEVYNEPNARIRVGKMARLLMDGAVPKVTGGALFYHNATVRPSWSRKFRRTATVGGHFFYALK